MDHNQDILDFIKRTQSPEFQEKVKEYCREMNYIANKWQRENPEKQRLCMKKFYYTKKGCDSRAKQQKNRRERFKIACENISWEEMELIGEFYRNCPLGYEVDHIIPISRGGKHCLSNLQYLTRLENAKKGYKLNWKRN